MKILFYAKLIVLSTFIIFFSPVFGQLSQPGIPMGVHHEIRSSLPEAEFRVMRKVDLDALRAEDKIMDTIRDIPFRFGENIDVNFNPGNSGKWHYFENGSRLWRLGVISKGAVSINLTFDQYHLPPGAKMFVYTPDGKRVIGAFTHLNNQEDGYFATTLLPGDEVIIEYYEPAYVAFKGEINLATVTHGYRGPGEFFSKGFGDAGSCNINVACPESVGWEDQIRSSAMLVTGSNGFCSGSLINNTENDGTPYFLSANHCYRTPGTLVFWFNWQSETCANPTTIPSHDAMSGAMDRARNAASDFWLMEFLQPIPEEYNVYFSGWNRSLEATIDGTVVGIHHPRADIKKFSWAESGVQAASYLGAPGSGTSHWRVGPWSGGTTTEPGSSGSPIYDPQGRILGQLHGGYAACGNLLADWYGRIGVSWTGGGSDATRLSTWLDPNNTGVMALFGYDPVLDAADPEAPAAVSDFTVIPGAEGALMAEISWTNPSLTFEGEELITLDSIKIFRGGELIFEQIDPVIGGAATFDDTNIDDAGNYTYTIRAINQAGISPPVNTTLFVGPDTPGQAQNILLVDLNNNGFLTWDAPVEGGNGGYFIPSSILEYHIVRHPDNAAFVVDAAQTELLDETLPGIGFYSYTITAVNEQGTGKPATSNEALLAAEGAVFMFTGTVTTCEGTFFDSGGPEGNYNNNENFTLTFFPEIEGAKINMQFTEFNTETSYDFLSVYNGDEAISDYLIGQFAGTTIPQELIDITSTHATGALTFRFTSDFSITRPGWRADITCYIPADDDLAATAIAGNLTPTVGTESVFSITVANLGFAAQNNYTVYLKALPDQLLASVSGTAIEPGEIIALEIPWTPSADQQGSMQIFGEVDLEGDANTFNNTTNPISINILPEGVQAVTIGNESELPGFRIPFDFYWRNSLVQTIYYEDEIIFESGYITGITYFNQFATNLPNKPVKIYIQQTELDNMSAGFVPVTSEQLVFEGEVNFPSGAHEIFIALDEPFNYNGGNILVTTLRPFDQQFFTINERFFASTTPQRPNRTIHFNSDQVTIDPENPPTTGTIATRDAHPNTTLFFDLQQDEPDSHTVTFHVDMSEVHFLLFDEAYDELFITGSMIDWAEPGSLPELQLMSLTDAENMIYSISMDLPEGEYDYKFFINHGWELAEWHGEPNRVVQVIDNITLNDIFGNGMINNAQVQFIHLINSSTGLPLEVQINRRPFMDQLSSWHASGFMDIPANYDFSFELHYVDEREQTVFYANRVNFDTDDVKIVIIAGTDPQENFSPSEPVDIFEHEGRIHSLQPGNIDILAFHGAPDLSEVLIRVLGMEDQDFSLSYGNFSGYHEWPSNNYFFDMTEVDSPDYEYSFGFGIEEDEWADKAIVMAISGIWQAENQNGVTHPFIKVALPEGGEMIPLVVLLDVAEEYLVGPQIKVFPNPARDQVRVVSSEEIVRLYLTDSQGRRLFLLEPASVAYELDTRHLCSGIYFLTLETNNGVSVKKMIIRK